MTDTRRPNSQDMAQLLQKYEAAARAEIPWKGAYPNYPESVSDLMQYITSSAWCNPNYPANDMRAIFMCRDSASIEEVQSMLTSIVRGERFCTGYWQSSLESGELKSVVDRAKQLIETAQ